MCDDKHTLHELLISEKEKRGRETRQREINEEEEQLLTQALSSLSDKR